MDKILTGYDHNGNMNADDGKSMTIAYNHLNLPREITRPWESSEQPGGILRFVYDATGRKLKKTLYAAGSSIELSATLYEGGIEKESKVLPDNSISSAIFVYHAEGRVACYLPSPTEYPFSYEPKWEYEYTLRDHLGNSRVTISDKNNDGYIQASGGDWSEGPIAFDYTEILQENHFYPFGLTMEGKWREPGLPRKENEYGYNGKELNEELGLGWLDYGARGYDGAGCVWFSIDPAAHKYYSWSPYNYVMRNPVRLSDPDGEEPEDCCPGLLGGLYGSIDNIVGTDLRSSVQYESATDQEAFDNSVSNADKVFLTGGTIMMAEGAIRGGIALGLAGESGGLTGGIALQAAAQVAVGSWFASNAAKNLQEETTVKANNPNGSKGKPDHQDKVIELEKKAQSEAKPNETVLTEKKIQGQPSSNRRPDVQIVDDKGKARKVLEAERKPNSTRNKKREKEYNNLGIDHETHKVGN